MMSFIPKKKFLGKKTNPQEKSPQLLEIVGF